MSLQVYNLGGLEDMLKKGYRSVTEGKFNDALGRFNAILHIIPLLVVETRREVDDVKELLGIAKCVPGTAVARSDMEQQSGVQTWQQGRSQQCCSLP